MSDHIQMAKPRGKGISSPVPTDTTDPTTTDPTTTDPGTGTDGKGISSPDPSSGDGKGIS